MESTPSLQRKLGLTEAVSLNMIDMVGIGPFVTLPLIMQLMPGKNALLAWLLGAILSLLDSLVWSELGAAYPQAGGSYQFLKIIFGKKRGKLFAFLYTWQTAIQAPLVVASGAIGFSQYFQYLIPLPEWWQQKLVCVVLILVLYALLNRNIVSTGKISKALWLGVLAVLTIVIGSGLSHFNYATFNAQPDLHFSLVSWGAWMVLGQASTKTIYCYLGYYNVCHLGAEIKQPERNIPRSMKLSVLAIAGLNLLLQWVVLGNIDSNTAAQSQFVFSTLMQHWFGQTIARWFTILILWVALSSLFAVMLGYSRVLYAAAADNNFIAAFAGIDKEKNIPKNSLLWLAIVGGSFSLLFKLKHVISAIVVLRILTQFISQSVGLLWLHKTGIRKSFPYNMPLFPLPVILSLSIWLFVFLSSDRNYIAGAFLMIIIGLIIYALKERRSKTIN